MAVVKAPESRDQGNRDVLQQKVDPLQQMRTSYQQAFSPSLHAILSLQDFLKIVPGTDLFRLSDEIRDKRSGIDGAHVVLDLFKILIQRPAKVGPGFLEEVIQVTSQVLVHDFSRIHLQLELTDDPKKIVVHARLECGLDNKVWLLVHISCSSRK